MHNSSSVIKMMIAVQWLLLVLVGGTSGSSEQNVKTSGFKTRYIQSCFSLLQNHQRLFVFYHFTCSFIFYIYFFNIHHYMSLNLINFPFAFFVQT